MHFYLNQFNLNSFCPLILPPHSLSCPLPSLPSHLKTFVCLQRGQSGGPLPGAAVGASQPGRGGVAGPGGGNPSRGPDQVPDVSGGGVGVPTAACLHVSHR